jgi:hypothetical protein
LREPPSSTPPQHRFQPVLQRFLQRSSQDLIRINTFGEFLEGPLQSFNRGFLEWTLLIGGLGIGLNIGSGSNTDATADLNSTTLL